VRRKISAHVDGGPSGASSMRRPGSEDPHWRERKFAFSLGLIVILDNETNTVGLSLGLVTETLRFKVIVNSQFLLG
jgi:hypothetical protein